MNYREIVQDMKPIDAVDWLLDQIESLDRVKFATHIEFPFHMSGMKRRLVGYLYRNRGKFVATEMIFDSLYADSLDPPEPKIIAVMVSQVRQILPAGWEIESRPTVGYQLKTDWTPTCQNLSAL